MMRALANAARGVVHQGVAAVQARTRVSTGLLSDMPEEMSRRPENSSAHYRSVQDWKPGIQRVAHLAGRDLPPDGSEAVVLHMMLVDHMGFRWPVRFSISPMMTLWEVINLTDQPWFGMFQDKMSTKLDYGIRAGKEDGFKCMKGMPDFWVCDKCLVALPYEYLECMAPPEPGETTWILKKMRMFLLNVQANCRLSCQVYIEDWMDGMTVVLPQTDSLAWNMYVNQGADKETLDMEYSKGPRYGGTPYPKGYLWKESDGPGNAEPEDVYERMRWRDSVGSDSATPSYFSAGPGGNIPLKDIFWTDYVDDIIREANPKHEGRYRFMKQ